MTRPPAVAPHSEPYARIVRFKNGRANLSATFAGGMLKGQDILIRTAMRSTIQGAANNARVRIRIYEYPALDTVRVVSLGPQRERVMSKLNPNRVQCFKTRRSPPVKKDTKS